LRIEHLTHCIDAIRQSLMCSSDISPLVWQWNNFIKRVRPQTGIVHTCRKFDKISDWAKKNKAITTLDTNTYIEDDIVIPEF
jgi:hypothetical protein